MKARTFNPTLADLAPGWRPIVPPKSLASAVLCSESQSCEKYPDAFLSSIAIINFLPMKRSTKIQLTLLASAAAALTGCDHTREAEVQRCLDEHNIVVDERNCETQSASSSPQQGPSGDQNRYRWMYGGNGGYTTGSVVSDAHDAPTDGLDTVRGSALAARGYTAGGARVGIGEDGGFSSPPSSRGGFGSTGHAMSGGGHEGGEAGGHGAGE